MTHNPLRAVRDAVAYTLDSGPGPQEFALSVTKALGIEKLGYSCQTHHSQGRLYANEQCNGCYPVYRLTGIEN